jgi:hypothetical protein
VVSVKTLLACVAMLCASACVSTAGCTFTTAHETNHVCDSELRAIASCWTTRGSFVVRHGLGPDGSTILYYPGTGRPSGFDNSAAFLATVRPGATYSFSAYIDGADHVDVPPYVILSAVNGTWSGASIYQSGKGRVSTVFTIPSNSHTTLVRGEFATENGTYPQGRGAIFAQPQLEAGDRAGGYAPSDASMLSAPPGGNLVPAEDDVIKPGWTLEGAMTRTRIGIERDTAAFVYHGNGRASRFGNIATARATVRPGATYTLSASVDGSAQQGAPPYIWVLPMNGRWPGTHTYQDGRGLVMLTFTVPPSSGTTCVEVEFSTQNGIYPRGASLEIAHAQMTQGDEPHRYVPGGAGSRCP